MNLDDLRDVKRPFAIQVATRGRRTEASPSQARELVVGALNTLNRSTGGRVKTLNTEINGKLIALAFIEDAQFDEDSSGSTTLEGME